jgi:hypothetical protein
MFAGPHVGGQPQLQGPSALLCNAVEIGGTSQQQYVTQQVCLIVTQQVCLIAGQSSVIDLGEHG